MAFGRMFLGFLFLFDFRINGFDVLPDVIGYALFLSGLSVLAGRNANYARGKTLAIVLLVLSLFDLVPVQIHGNGASFFPLFILLALVSTVLGAMFIYSICLGIQEEARQADLPDLERTAKFRWQLYLVLAVAICLVTLMPFLALLLVIPLFLFSLVVLGLLMGLMKQAEQQLG